MNRFTVAWRQGFSSKRRVKAQFHSDYIVPVHPLALGLCILDIKALIEFNKARNKRGHKSP